MIDIKLLIKYSKLATPILVLFSLSKQVLYYSLFDIKIGYFIGIEEVMAPFIGDLLFYTLSFLIPVILIQIFWGDIIGIENFKRIEKYKTKPFWERVFCDVKQYWPFWSLQIISIIIMIIKKSPVELILSTATFAPLLFLFYWIRKEAMIKHKIEFNTENTTLYNLSTLLVVIFLVIISNTFSEVYSLKYKKSKKVAFEYDSKKIQCGDSLLYLGRTKGYTFIYNKKSKQSEIFNNSSIKKVIMYE